jgi:hypothetical protein
MKANLQRTFSLLAIIGLLLLLEKLQLPDNSRLWREIQNAGHAVFFGILSLLILGLSIRFPGTRIKKHYLHYLISLVLTTILGAISEYVQIAGPRDADIWDLVRDIAGTLSFLGLYMVFDKQMATFWGTWVRKIRFMVLGGVLLSILATFAPVALCIGAYLHRNRAFPAILRFESLWELKSLKLQDAQLAIVSPPHGWKANQGDSVGELTFQPSTYSGFVIEEPYPNWVDYKSLSFKVYSELESTINVNVRIDDVQHNGSYDDRFTRAYAIKPGANKIVVPLNDVKYAPVRRTMDMTAISAFYLFAFKTKASFAIYIDDIRLE